MAGMKQGSSSNSVMAEDYHNGMRLVPLESRKADQWIPSTAAGCTEHPWRALMKPRTATPPESATKPPETLASPTSYYGDKMLRVPAAPARYAGRHVEVHETIRLSDVEAFRKKTAMEGNPIDPVTNPVDDLTARVSRLSTSSSVRPVIYRYIDVIENNIALLEAVHFELFMPDRPDLRFLGIPFPLVPSGTIQGDYCRIQEVSLLSHPSFAVSLGGLEYPVIWEIKKLEKMDFTQQTEKTGLAYIIDKKEPTPGIERCVSLLSDREFVLRATVFSDPELRCVDSIVRVTTRMSSTAHLYPVEPPLPPPPPPTESEEEEEDKENSYEEEDGVKKRRRKRKGLHMSEYAARVCNVRTSSQRSALFVSSVRPLDDKKAERIIDRLEAFTTYGETGDLRLMDKLFQLGSAFRMNASAKADLSDTGEYRVDEGVILKTMRSNELAMAERCRSLLNAIYGSQEADHDDEGDGRQITVTRAGRDPLTLNAQQSRTVRMYAEQHDRVFCILSPPGSGKTTVAAAMAAEVARNQRSSSTVYSVLQSYGRGGRSRQPPPTGSVQLLMSVQNVAVDNMGVALKELNYGSGEVYNMKSTKKLDPFDVAPFDLFDKMTKYTLEDWKERKLRVEGKRKNEKEKGNGYHKAVKDFEEELTKDRRESEKTMRPRIILATVEMVLFKLFTPSALCASLACVDRIIIDEASLLTEAALYCIIRRFPQARFVLIGDDRQLPPFMYDERVLGHELAGRPALSVALKNGAAPIVRLTEVYRAPPSLVEPYNRLAYGGTLKSRKPEGYYPLSDLGLIHSGRPQLLFIEVDGQQERDPRTMSLYNDEEAKALQSLLKKFPRGWEENIMIICLYKQQKRRVQDALGKKYTVLTVDSSQGKEKSIVILLTTRTEHGVGFFYCEKRCNVSISRQQSALIILGKKLILTTNKPWSTVVNGDDFTRITADAIA